MTIAEHNAMLSRSLLLSLRIKPPSGMTREDGWRRKLLAYHESGHCVVSREIGLESEVVIDSTHGGLTRNPGTVLDGRISAVAEVAICMAGQLAERLSGVPAYICDELDASTEVQNRDGVKAMALSQDQNYWEPMEHLKAGMAMAKRIIFGTHSREVHRVAAEIERCGVFNRPAAATSNLGAMSMPSIIEQHNAALSASIRSWLGFAA